MSKAQAVEMARKSGMFAVIRQGDGYWRVISPSGITFRCGSRVEAMEWAQRLLSANKGSTGIVAVAA